MKHELFFDGNLKEYSWSIKTGKEIINQIREHPAAYLSGGKLDIKNKEESRFVALHVGIYWGLGVFIIKDFDKIHVMCDSKEMYEILIQQHKTLNQIINVKIQDNLLILSSSFQDFPSMGRLLPSNEIRVR